MHRLSYACGPGQISLVYRTLPSLMNQRAVETPNKPAHIFRHPVTDEEGQHFNPGRKVLTFAELAEKSLNLAGSLLDIGLKPGDVIAVIGINCPEWIYLEYACLRVGALLIKVPSHFSSAEELCGILQKTKPKVLVVDPEAAMEVLSSAFPFILGEDTKIFEQHGLGSISKLLLLRESRRDKLCHLTSVTNLASSVPASHLTQSIKKIEAAMNPDDPAFVYLTSGSTGIPKSVLYSHYRSINGFRQATIKGYALDSKAAEMVMFNDRPFAWGGSFLYNPVIFGFTHVHVDTGLTLKGDSLKFIFDILEDEKVTAGLFMLYLLFDVMEYSKAGTLTIPATLRNIITGGDKIPNEILQFAQTTFETIQVVYCASECISIATSKQEHQKYTMNLNWYEINSPAEIKLLDEEGKIVPQGEVGVVHVRSPHSMIEYFDTSSPPDKSIPAGWIDMGDLAIMREDGCIEIMGRTNDVISRGTVKVYPKTLENILYRHDKVAKAVVVGVPDPRLFQEVCACIIPKAGVTVTEAELREFFAAQIQANVMSFVPKYYLILDELPKGSSGKFDRKALLKLAVNYFKLSEK